MPVSRIFQGCYIENPEETFLRYQCSHLTESPLEVSSQYHLIQTLTFAAQESMHVEKLVRDPSKLTRPERMRILSAQSPELLPLVDELQEAIRYLEDVIRPVKAKLAVWGGESGSSSGGSRKGKVRGKEEESGGESQFAQYLGTKEQLLYCYICNILFYLTLKASGGNVQKHPVMRQMLEVRYSMQKMEFADNHFKREVDQWLGIDENGGMVGKEGGEAWEEEVENDSAEDDDDEADGEDGEDGEEDEGEDNDDDEDDDSNEEARARQEDDELFAKTSYACKAAPTKKLLRLPNTSITDYGEYDEKSDRLHKASKGEAGLEKLASALRTFAAANKKEGKDAGKKSKADNDDVLADLHDLRAKKGSKRSAEEQLDDDYDDDADGDEGFAAMLSGGKGRVRRPAPFMGDDDDGDLGAGVGVDKRGRGGVGGKGKGGVNKKNKVNLTDDLVERFSKTKKDFIAKKTDHYTPAPRFGGYEEIISEGKKRAATYEMIKNKGLTPHRKKENRNPRVKKRLMYAKAVVARKGQVRDVTREAGAGYGGELTGIKANLARSRKIGT